MDPDRHKHVTWQLLVIVSLLFLASLVLVIQGELLGWVGLLIHGLVLVFLLGKLPSAADVIRFWAVLLMLPAIVFWLLTILMMLDPGGGPVTDRVFSLLSLLKNALLVYGIIFARRAKGIVAYWRSIQSDRRTA